LFRAAANGTGSAVTWALDGFDLDAFVAATLAEDLEATLGAITAARATARERVWSWAGAPVQDGWVVVDLDATLVTAHSTGIGTGSRSADVL